MAFLLAVALFIVWCRMKAREQELRETRWELRRTHHKRRSNAD